MFVVLLVVFTYLVVDDLLTPRHSGSVIVPSGDLLRAIKYLGD